MNALFDQYKDQFRSFEAFEKASPNKRHCCCELVRTDDWYECRFCHVIEPLFVESVNSPSQTYFINLAYTPVTHFKATIHQLQGKQNKEIPQSILELCKDCTTIADIQNQLRVHQKPTFYKHKMKIANLLGLTIPKLSLSEELQCIDIFKQRFPMKQNKNNIPYQFVLYKLMELIQRKDIQVYLELTKNKTKLKRYETIWRAANL